jgi:hypothetical protein
VVLGYGAGVARVVRVAAEVGRELRWIDEGLTGIFQQHRETDRDETVCGRVAE